MPDSPEKIDADTTADLSRQAAVNSTLPPGELLKLIAILEESGAQATEVTASFQARFPEYSQSIAALSERLAPDAEVTQARAHDRTVHRTAQSPGVEGPRRGKFAIVSLHAEGGLGKVSVALDERIGRHVALKEIRADRVSHEAQHRFVNEAEITGQLEHPGIVPVYTMDEDEDGQPFYVMRFIEGETLSTAIKRCHAAAAGGSAVTELLPRFLDICQAVAYAHSKGIIHRDLKPANVMLGEYGETLVLDWGLAKRLGDQEPNSAGTATAPVDSPWSTMDGDVLGTPSYFAPEQARGEIQEIDARCDVFGLGGILCAIITGAPPFQGESVQEVFQQARQGDVSSAISRLEQAGCDPELVDIARRCLAPDAADRPADAGVVADAVSGYQAGVQERLQQAEFDRVAARTKAAEEVKRRRVTVGLGIALALLLAAGGLGVWSYQRQQQQFASDLSASWTAADERIGEAYDYTDDPFRMQKTLDMGAAHLQQAQQRLDDANRGSGQLSERQTQLQEQLAAAKRDLGVLESFYGYEVASTHVDVQNSKYDTAGAIDQLVHNLFHYCVQGYLASAGVVVEEVNNPALPDVDAVGKSIEVLQSRPTNMQHRLREMLVVAFSEAVKTPNTQEAHQYVTWLQQLIAAIDDNPWRQQVIQAMAAKDHETLQRIAADVEVEVETTSPMFLASYSDWLPYESRGAFLRRLQTRFPASFWINESLGRYHTSGLPAVHEGLPPARVADVRAAVRYYTAARAARPTNAGMCLNLGLALERLGQIDEAIATYRAAVQHEPEYFAPYENLGFALQSRGDLKAAAEAFRQAVRLNPSAYRWARLGEVLTTDERLEEAIDCYSQGVALEPDKAVAHFELATALHNANRLDESLACYQRGLELDRDNTIAWGNLGILQREMQDFAGAAESYRRSLAIDPRQGAMLFGLAQALLGEGQITEAVAAQRRATTVPHGEPKRAFHNLGIMYLSRVVDHAQAEEAFRRAIALDPRASYAMAYLGQALQRQGQIRAALVEFRRADVTQKRWPASNQAATEDWIREAEKTLQLATGLPLNPRQLRALAGQPAERVLLAAWQCHHEGRWKQSAPLIRHVMEREGQLISDHLTGVRHMAAVTLIQAADGDAGNDKLAREDRHQALQWLTADYEAWTSPDQEEIHARRGKQVLAAWLADENLAPVRDDALTTIPEAERAGWTEFWTQIRDQQAAR